MFPRAQGRPGRVSSTQVAPQESQPIFARTPQGVGPFGMPDCPAEVELTRKMRSLLPAAIAAVTLSPSSACVTEVEDTDELAGSGDSGGEVDSEASSFRTTYGPFNSRTIAPAPGTTPLTCPSWIPWCDDEICGSCNSWTSNHGQTCISCTGSDCNCSVGAPPWTGPNGIVYTNRWYPSVP